MNWCHNGTTFDEPPSKETLIELGAGSGRKTSTLISNFSCAEKVYSPIDISEGAIKENLGSYNAEFLSSVNIKPYVGTWKDCLPQTASLPGCKTFLFLGSSLGNYTDEESVELFKSVKAVMHGQDRLVIGVDTAHNDLKPAEIIEAAYNDKAGVTADFTLNALTHVSRVSGINISREDFEHEAKYHKNSKMIITHVVAKRDLEIKTLEGNDVLQLSKGDKIFMEMR